MSTKPDISKELENNRTILLILSPGDHDSLKKFILPIKKKKICYVSLSRTYETVQKEMKELGVDQKNLHVLDAVSSSFSRDKPPPQVTFVPSPDALTDLNIAIIETIKNEKCDFLVFDSVSTLLTYREDPLIARFVDFIVGKVKSLKSKAIFTCLESDSKSQAISEISLHVDKIISMNEFDGKGEEKK
jgi:KaiC/GvpD/RAD55 family RecA-like ATPase